MKSKHKLLIIIIIFKIQFDEYARLKKVALLFTCHKFIIFNFALKDISN